MVLKKYYFLICLACSLGCTAQVSALQKKLSALPGVQLLAIPNQNFREYFQLTFTQAPDHAKPAGKKFQQRIFLGVQDLKAPVVFQTEGYAADYAVTNYTNELAKELNANLIVVEHRFMGASLPDSLNWNLLTLKQAAGDYHAIKELLDDVLTGKWISTGISKGGQAALAYKLFYPRDVIAVVAYGAAVKNKQSVSTDSVLKDLAITDAGKKIKSFQLFAFRNKKQLLPLVIAHCALKQYNLKPLDPETVLDYLLLELPYAFWQTGKSAEEIPDSAAGSGACVNYLFKVVSPGIFSLPNRLRLGPAFYMFYHELGYYEYETAPFKNYLKQKAYPNSYFAPEKVPVKFDDSFQKQMQKFISSSSAENVFFVYGEHDPWALQSIAKKNVYTVKNGSHKSRIADLSDTQKNDLLSRIKKLVDYK
jgi:hypothetical protein